ncbi:PIR Superfamily Protein [Plasmodium ovale curtisi]|uniref:PIR Superfamily Protein n=1 Tax=Plasmodium ovale curtisi TaxID=864141 RepID=A0A1A8WS07_PLAOA|nr:PIR Superfamily Protein [Plasmodium ovale curtisi]
MDTKALRRDYPFLSKTWDMYDEFDETVKERGFPDYSNKCKHIVSNYNKNIKEYDDFCMKLLRNLYTMADVMDESENTNVPCTYLNMWLYYKEKIHEIPVEFIKHIFRIADELIKNLQYPSKCEYDESHKNHQEPYKIMLLNIFLDNAITIGEIMEKNGDSKQENCLNFVKECLSIYNHIKTKYCLGEEKDLTFKATCEEIKIFERVYTEELKDNAELGAKMPSLTFSGHVLKDRVRLGYQDKASMPGKDEDAVNPGSDHASAVGGTVVGISSFLLLMYQFTPLGRWLRSRISRRTEMSDHLGEEEMDHMYLNAYGNDGMYSDDMGYNMGYNTM